MKTVSSCFPYYPSGGVFAGRSLVALAINSTICLAISVMCLLCLQGCTKTPPQMVFDSKVHDFHAVEEGVVVKHSFQVQNAGGTDLKITEAKSTCGCTTVTLGNAVVPAGGHTTISVEIDTALKQGHVDREITVRSNDPKAPLVSLFLKADILDPHKSLTGSVQAKIFQGRCAVCHVNEGIDKEGEDLYLADCSMCHGFKAQGGFAPGLMKLDLDNKLVARQVTKIITDGSPTHRSMPGFGKAKGGPLTEAQIASLIEYLKWRKKQDIPK